MIAVPDQSEANSQFADREVELKLGLSPRSGAILEQLPLIQESAIAGPAQNELETIYYDTPGLDLFRAGQFLRVRHTGDKYIQALKSRGSAFAGLETRRESECEIGDERPNVALIVDPPPCLSDPGVARALRATVRTTFTRAIWMIATGDGGRIELAYDRGFIHAGDRRLPLCELELELKQGQAADVFDFALALGAALPLRTGDESKAVRGFRAVEGRPPDWSKAAKVGHADTDTAEDAFVRIVAACLEQMSANRICAAEGASPEGVHQYRVGIRRLRSVLAITSKLIGGDERMAIRGELRWLADQLGPARDIDVFVDEILGPIIDYFGPESDVVTVRALAEARTITDYRRVRRALMSRRALRLILTMGRWVARRAWRMDASKSMIARLDQPVGDFAASVLDKRHRRLHRLGASLEHRTVDDLHRLRIEIKKQRYAVEHFASLFASRAVQRYLLSLKALQDALGTLNDAAVAHRILDDLLAGLPRTGARRRDAERGAAMVIGWHGAEVVGHRRVLNDRWRRWRRCRRFWT